MKKLDISHVYADTRQMTREEWLKSRRGGIGGSDACAILGLNPYTSPLSVYLDKIGKAKEEEENEAMRVGRDLEGYVAQRFTEETGLKVKRCNRILQHPEHPWMLANIDRQVIGENAGLECKTTSPFSKYKFEDGELNPHYYWQSMHYMAVTGADKWYVAVLVLGKAFHIFAIDRDEDAIGTLIAAEEDFWFNHVQKKDPPLPTGSEADDDAINVIYPQGSHDSEDVMALDDLEDTMNLRALKKQQRDDLDKEITEIDQTIKMALGDYQKGVSARWKVSWINTSTNRVDTKALKAKYPAIARELTKATPGRRFSIALIEDKEA